MAESESEFEREQEDAAAADAAKIGGRASDDPPTGWDEEETDEAHRPLVEAGEGESEGFELSEYELSEHASHGDEHAARRVLEDAGNLDEDDRSTAGGEGDEEIGEDQ